VWYTVCVNLLATKAIVDFTVTVGRFLNPMITFPRERDRERDRAPPRRAAHRRHWLFCALLVGITSCGCGVPLPEEGRQGEGPGHRSQPLALTPEQELELGREAYHEVLEKYRGRILPASRPESQRVHDVTARIVRAAGIRPLQREINLHMQGYRYEWEVHVIRSDQVNAFALPGGKIVVFTAILPVAENDDQLATVLSHEIAHVLAHHASERVAREHSGVAGLLQRKAFDRAQESEADHIGVFLMTFAGYDPAEAVRFWERMQRISESRGRLPEFLSDHPSDARRIHDLQAWVPRARAAKQAYDEGRIAPEAR
jgi:predicted Zn-dependent protease